MDLREPINFFTLRNPDMEEQSFASALNPIGPNKTGAKARLTKLNKTQTTVFMCK